jgi:hypothetical protein
MDRTSKTPPGKGGVMRDCFAGVSRDPSTLEAYQAQFLCLACAVRPEWAAMLAALAFGGGRP